MKKILLILALCFGCNFISATAYNGVCGEDVVWNLNTEDSVLHLIGMGDMIEYAVSEDVPWDTLRSYIKKVEIDERITSLAKYMLYACENLEEVSFADHLTKMPLLSKCARLHTIKLSQNLSSIQTNCFDGCDALDSLYIYDKVTTFQSRALAGIGNLRYVSWGPSVRTIGDLVANKTSIEKLDYRGDLADWCSTNINSNTIFRSGTSFYLYGQFADSLYIPDSVTSISRYAFSYYAKLRYVSYNEGTTVNPQLSFEGLNIKIYVRDGLGVDVVDYEQGKAGNLTWMYTRMDKTLNFVQPSALTPIPDYSTANPAPWSGLLIDSIHVPYNISRIGNCAFANLSSFHARWFNYDLTSIGDSAFYGCVMFSGTTVIPLSVDTIGRDVFEGCEMLDTIKYYRGLKFNESSFPSNKVIIEKDTYNQWTPVFYITISFIDSTINLSGSGTMATGTYPWRRIQHRITHIRVTGEVTSIPPYLFGNMNKVRDVRIESPLVNIGAEAFHSCTSLSFIKLPRELKTIGARAFHMCKNIVSITCLAETPPQLGSSAWGFGYAKTAVLYVPASSIPLYKVAEQWKDFDIQPILVEIDSIAPDTTNLTWNPVDSASLYKLHLYTDSTSSVGLDTTLLIKADSLHGGTMASSGFATVQRVHHVALDDIGSVVIITIDPTSGTSADNPYLVTVSTTSGERIEVHYGMTVFKGTKVIREDAGLFVLNDAILDAIENIYAPSFPSGIYDLHGRRYSMAVWESLPAGVYILKKDNRVVKVMK